jgi:arginine-tRNA-protein transferase
VYSPGIFSVIREIEFARDMGKEYYYLGYYVAECPRMRYKNTFRPTEKYSWDEKKWLVGA